MVLQTALSHGRWSLSVAYLEEEINILGPSLSLDVHEVMFANFYNMYKSTGILPFEEYD